MYFICKEDYKCILYVRKTINVFYMEGRLSMYFVCKEDYKCILYGRKTINVFYM